MRYPLLSLDFIALIRPYFPKTRGLSKGDDQLILSGIYYVIKNGLRWIDVPSYYGNHKTIYNRFVRWSKNGTFDRIFSALSSSEEHGDLQIDSSFIKCHRTAASLFKKKLMHVKLDGVKVD